ncbi:MAG: dihydrodipicolinate synthase family protein [Acidimicrobiales bacterium]|nr:dihydrodipicolinate synthase family protein [Acidimicrobiales bacterium]
MLHVLTMSVTPFDSNGALDEAALRDHLLFLAQSGVGVYLCSQGSGEGHLLTPAERRRVWEIGVETLGGTVPVRAAGVGLSGTHEARELAHAAAAIGVDEIQVLPPVIGAAAPRRSELVNYYDTVLDGLDADIALSHNPFLAGHSLPLALIDELADRHPRLVACNWSDPNAVSVMRAVEGLRDRVAVRSGIVTLLPHLDALGADGVLCYEPNVAPEIVTGWRDDLARLLRLHEALARPGNPRSLKAAMAMLGRPAGPCRSPYLPLPTDEVDRLRADLAALGLSPVAES